MANSESDKILEFLHGIQLDQFYRRIHDELHVTRLNHFAHVKEQDLDDLGLSKPEQRRLFEALKKSKKKLLFGSFRRKKSKTKLFSLEPDNEEPSRPSLASVFKPVTPPSPPLPSTSLTCVIDEKKLVLHEMLGTGAFGYVRKGEWITDKNKKVDVAVKCLKISKDCAFLQLQLDFTKEANGMSRLDHPHIIKLYGVVLSTPIMLVTEIAPLGCLLTCLRDENPKFLISQLCEFVVQVASGMAYLEAEHYIHRDLAARNLLLSSFDTVKIGDFGLTRPLGTEEDYYTMNPKGKVPFAWCPPESLKFRKFSHASDMWSFGILLMELFSYGEEPWPGLNCTQILQKVDMPNAERPQKPSHCPSKIYNVVLNHCWAHDPAHRPTFAAIQNIMEQIRPEDVKAKHSFDSETPQNLPFVEGDAVTLIEASPDANWWRGQNKRTGRVGMFPSEMVDRPSGSPSPTIIRSASIAKKVSKSPVPCTPGKQNCDCGEDHLYDLPFIINSPNTASSPTRSQDSDFTCSTESGYSSSLSQSISESNRRDSSANYENCISTPNYELMEPTVKIKPTRPAPTPYEESKDLGSSNSPPVTIPERKDSLQEKRLSDSSLEQVAKKRSDKPRSTGPFTLSRRVSSKKLKSFDIPIKRRDSSSPVNSSSTNTDRNSMPSLSANQSPSSSRPNSRNSIGSMSPDRSPVLRPKSEISEQSPSKVSPRARSFARSCSSGGFSSKSLRDAQQRIKSPSPTDMYSKDDINFKGSSSDGFSSKSLRDAQQSIKSPSPMDTTDDISFKGRSYSFGSPSQRGCQRTELYENHEYIPRCHTVSGTSTYDNHKLNRSPNRDTFYENHEIVNTYNKAQNLVNSRSNIEEGLGSNTYDNHRLQSQPASERSQGSSVPQGYEKMVLRKSYFEKEPNAFDAKPKNTSYENYSVGSIRNSQVPYENFVIVKHSDVPEEIRTTLNNLKCPSYENQGFEELRAQAENDLIKESDILDNVFQDYSCSLPNSENWGVVKKTLDNNGSLVIKMGRSITPRLRKSSSDGDLRDEEDINLDFGSASSGCKETRPARCSLDITGELASALSNRMNIKENVTITNNGVKFAEALMETFKSPKELEGSSLQDRDLGNSSEPAQTVESFKNSQEFHESSQKDKVLGNTNESVQFDPSLNNERVGIPFNDVPPPLPERKKRSSSRVANEDFISNSYENVNKDVTVPQRNEPIPNKETLQNEVIEDKTTDIEDTHSSPPRPNVLCFENRLAAFMSPKLIKKVNVEDDVPDLPPKARSLPRSQKSTSNYPRLSRDSSDVKLTFADDVNRYRPCPTKASPNYEYPRRSGNEGDETPPPLPKKHSKTSPDVPVRPDMSCN